MSEKSPVRYEVSDGVATVTLDRPEAMNALDTATKVALREALEKAGSDVAVRAVVLTGEGRAFCVGQDLREHVTGLEADAAGVWSTVREHYNPIVRALATMPKPVIAAVNGIAAGAGASFAFACDFRIVADTAGFNLAFAGIGLTADSGASWSLPRLVGHARATELLLRPTSVSATDALTMGLATSVVPLAGMHDAAMRLARELASGPTVAYAAIKRSLAYSASHGLDESLELEAELQTEAGTTQDHLNAVRAFVAKEKPTFEGR